MVGIDWLAASGKTQQLMAAALRIMCCALGTVAGLWAPDIDLLALPLLHHRSIITHSIFIPWAVGRAFTSPYSVGTVVGLYLGVSIHLAADVLAPVVGFGMIWLPWPLKVPLGPLSPLWIGANSVLAALLALQRPGYGRYGLVSVALLAAAGYATFHEDSVWAFLAFCIVLFFARLMLKRQKSQ